MTAEAPAPADRPQNPRVLVSAASLHGATAEIAQAIGQVLSQRGFDATVMPPGEVDAVDDYDAVIIGSAVYMGHWLDPAKDFVNRFRHTLAGCPVWLFSSGPVGDPSGKLAQAMGKDPADVPVMLEATHARDHRMFAGKLDRKHLSLPQRAALLVSAAWRVTSATAPASGSGPTASPVSLRWRHGESGTAMVQQDTHRPALGPAGARKVSAARIMAAAFGIGAGLLGLEHGFFETRQGSATPGGLVIHAIGPPCQSHTAWHGCEPALTVIPSFAATGIAAMVLAVAVLIWAAAFVTRPHGGLILLLVVALFVAGGGFTTFWFGLLAGIAATQITAPSARWRIWLGSRLTRLLARLWPRLLLAYLAWAAGSWIVAAISNAVMLWLTPAVTAATPFVLALILLSALAHDSQQRQAAQQPGSPPPDERDAGQHGEARHGQD